MLLNKLGNNFKFCAKYQISYNYLYINAKKHLWEFKSRQFKQGSKFKIWQSTLKTYKIWLQYQLISTHYKIIQTNLVFANTIWKHMIIKNLDYLFQKFFTESKALQKHSSQRVKHYKNTPQIFKQSKVVIKFL